MFGKVFLLRITVNAEGHPAGKDDLPMRKLARAGGLAAAATASALMAAPAAVAGPAQHHPRHWGPKATFGHIQPGGPIVLARPHGSLGARSWAGMTRSVSSDNWGGFAAGHPGTKFRYIQGTFFVPYLDCAHSPGAFSGHWVGIDGLGSPTVEQDGIVAACRGTTPVYASWYEMFPRPPVYSSMRVRPGNSIFASVAYSARRHKFILTLTNTTNGQSFTVARRCPHGSVCRRSSAEAISEAPSGADGPLPLADFRAESYTNVRAVSQGGQSAGLRSRFWNTLSITTVNLGSGKLLDQPTSIYRGSAFGMYWMRMN